MGTHSSYSDLITRKREQTFESIPVERRHYVVDTEPEASDAGGGEFILLLLALALVAVAWWLI